MEELQKSAQDASFKEKEITVAPRLEESISKLAKYGGFAVLDNTIEGVKNLSPEAKARKKIFLTEDARKLERIELKRRLERFLEVLEHYDSVAEIIENTQQKADVIERVLTDNVAKAVRDTRELESSYRSVNLFFKNTELDKVDNVNIMNAELDQLKDMDLSLFIGEVSAELQKNFDRLHLRDSYSLLVIPGYLGKNSVVEEWGKIAYKNKVMLVTDFLHLDGPADVIENFEKAELTGGDAFRSNVIMACNWLVGRGKYQELGEEEDLYVAPSAALAGKIYSTLMSQVTAGKKHGGMNAVDGVAFPLKKSEIASLEKRGLVPMVNEYGKVMAFSAKTLFNGDNLGLQTYSVVRVFDYVTKVLIDFLNRRAFENFDFSTRQDIQRQIIKFLDNITGPGNLIENFKILRFEQDPNQKDRIYLNIHMTPYFPAKNFMIQLDGQSGEDSTKWEAEYNQTN